jgi:hypothetical protein
MYHSPLTVKHIARLLFILLTPLWLAACTPAPPDNIDNICHIFMQYPKWYWDARATQKRWQVPVYVQMAIMHQESKFDGTARPPRRRILWIIPWKRPTTAYGYAQVIDGTWKDYQISPHGRRESERDDFADASHFIGWYAAHAKRRAYIKPDDPYRLYLAYHEGVTGYLHGSYNRKPWLINVAKKVRARSHLYQVQLRSCQKRIPKCHWWSFCSG